MFSTSFSHHSLRTLHQITARRALSVSSQLTEPAALARRSWLYVPCASERKMDKGSSSGADVVVYDLEDSVPPSKDDKDAARRRLEGLSQSASQPSSRLPKERTAVRVNDCRSAHHNEDVSAAVANDHVSTLLLPKVNSPEDLDRTASVIVRKAAGKRRIDVVASIESARALVDVARIAAWRNSVQGDVEVRLAALLFAAEDFCADTHIIRSRSREELLYPRSSIAITARAFGLEAIDMVCIHYKDPVYLRDECEDGRRLGFSGKQAIHPAQVETIGQTFAPSPDQILRAARILHAMERAHAQNIGAVGLDDGRGGTEMIDAPMIKQAEGIVRIAKAAGLKIPDIHHS